MGLEYEEWFDAAALPLYHLNYNKGGEAHVFTKNAWRTEKCKNDGMYLKLATFENLRENAKRLMSQWRIREQFWTVFHFVAVVWRMYDVCKVIYMPSTRKAVAIHSFKSWYVCDFRHCINLQEKISHIWKSLHIWMLMVTINRYVGTGCDRHWKPHKSVIHRYANTKSIRFHFSSGANESIIISTICELLSLSRMANKTW